MEMATCWWKMSVCSLKILTFLWNLQILRHRLNARFSNDKYCDHNNPNDSDIDYSNHSDNDNVNHNDWHDDHETKPFSHADKSGNFCFFGLFNRYALPGLASEWAKMVAIRNSVWWKMDKCQVLDGNVVFLSEIKVFIGNVFFCFPWKSKFLLWTIQHVNGKCQPFTRKIQSFYGKCRLLMEIATCWWKV